MSWHRLLADLTVAVHAAYVGFVVLGLLAILIGLALGWSWVRNFWFRAAHLAMIVVVVLEAWFDVTCPLTTLEFSLRQRAGQAVHGESFVGYWAHRLIFFRAETWVFNLLYTLFGLTVLATFVFGPPR